MFLSLFNKEMSMFKFKLAIFFLNILSVLSFPLSVYANTNNQETTTQYVKGSTITADIKTRLLADPDIKSLHISVTTKKDVVTLQGYVETQAQIDKAISIAKEVDGVTSVNNKLKIRPATH